MLPGAFIVLTEAYISVIMTKCVASVMQCLKVSVVLCSFFLIYFCGVLSSPHASVWNV